METIRLKLHRNIQFVLNGANILSDNNKTLQNKTDRNANKFNINFYNSNRLQP